MKVFLYRVCNVLSALFRCWENWKKEVKWGIEVLFFYCFLWLFFILIHIWRMLRTKCLCHIRSFHVIALAACVERGVLWILHGHALLLRSTCVWWDKWQFVKYSNKIWIKNSRNKTSLTHLIGLYIYIVHDGGNLTILKGESRRGTWQKGSSQAHDLVVVLSWQTLFPFWCLTKRSTNGPWWHTIFLLYTHDRCIKGILFLTRKTQEKSCNYHQRMTF